MVNLIAGGVVPNGQGRRARGAGALAAHLLRDPGARRDAARPGGAVAMGRPARPSAWRTWHCAGETSVILAYDLLLVPLVILAAPLLLLAALVGAFGPLGSVLERLRPLPRMPERTVWVHAASVGEVEAAAPLIARLVDQGVPVIATATTVTGRARLRARLPRVRTRLAPLDLPGLVHWSLGRARVSVLVLIETELWPNLLAAAASRGTRAIVAGGRISDRSFPRYRALSPFFAPLLARLHGRGPSSTARAARGSARRTHAADATRRPRRRAGADAGVLDGRPGPSRSGQHAPGRGGGALKPGSACAPPAPELRSSRGAAPP